MDASKCSCGIIALASISGHIARCFIASIINRCHFHTKGREMNKKCQNSGVNTTTTECYDGCS